jgi:excisionase family DNA binding protein
MTTNESPDQLLTPEEAAERLAITVEQLTSLVFDGDIAYITVGRGKKRPRRRFTQADLDDFIERHRRREVRLPESIGRGNRNISLRTSRATKLLKRQSAGFMALREELLAEAKKRRKDSNK